MFLVLVWRPEASDVSGGNFKHRLSPFSGIEVLGVVETEDDVNALIDRAQMNMEPKPGTWKFHYEELPAPVEFPGGVNVQ